MLWKSFDGLEVSPVLYPASINWGLMALLTWLNKRGETSWLNTRGHLVTLRLDRRIET